MRDSATGTWHGFAGDITTGDVDGDEIDDLIGIWPTQGGVWVKYSTDWGALVFHRPGHLGGEDEGFREGGEAQLEGTLGGATIELPFPMGGTEEGPGLP